MRLDRRAMAAILTVILLPVAARSAIYEYRDPAGKVLYYKYTDRRGSVVFTDDLGAIPPEARRGQAIIRRDAPGSKKVPAAKSPAPAAPAPPPAPRYKVEPLETATSGEGGWVSDLLAYLGLLAGGALLGGLAIAGRRFLAGRRRTGVQPRADGLAEERPPFREADSAEGVGVAQLGRSGLHGAAPASAAAERPQDALDKALEGGDFASAARLSESLGNLERAAAYYRRAGDEDRALDLYLKARLFAEAAPLLERRGEFLRAAEVYLRAGDAEKAAACFEQGGEPRRGHATLSDFHYGRGEVERAASHAELGGDLLRAAELFQEAGDFARAGRLHLAAGFFDEAAESFLLAGDQAGASEALERAGRHLEAAGAALASGAPPARIAALYEAGGDDYGAGRFFARAGELDRALAALQRVDSSAANARNASLLIGMIFLKRGMTGPAAERFEALAAGKPVVRETLDPWYFLALCRQAAGRRDEARAIFERILAVDAGFRDVKQRLDGPTSG